MSEDGERGEEHTGVADGVGKAACCGASGAGQTSKKTFMI